jgi:hypothetical protein
MFKIGRILVTTVERLGSQNAAAAYRRFARSPTDAEDRRLRQEVTAAVIGLVLVLGLVGWALTL